MSISKPNLIFFMEFSTSNAFEIIKKNSSNPTFPVTLELFNEEVKTSEKIALYYFLGIVIRIWKNVILNHHRKLRVRRALRLDSKLLLYGFFNWLQSSLKEATPPINKVNFNAYNKSRLCTLLLKHLKTFLKIKYVVEKLE